MTVRVKIQSNRRRPGNPQDLYSGLSVDEQQRLFLWEVKQACRYYAGSYTVRLEAFPITVAACRALSIPLDQDWEERSAAVVRSIDLCLDALQQTAHQAKSGSPYECLKLYLAQDLNSSDLPYSFRTRYNRLRLGVQWLAHYLSVMLRPFAPWIPAMPAPIVRKHILTRRELEILQLTADGYSSEDISAELYIERSTLSSHWKSLHSKLNTQRRIEALRQAHQLELINLTQIGVKAEVQHG